MIYTCKLKRVYLVKQLKLSNLHCICYEFSVLVLNVHVYVFINYRHVTLGKQKPQCIINVYL